MTVFCPSHIVTSSGVLLINDPKLEDFQFILDTKTASNLHISEQQPCFLAMSFQKNPQNFVDQFISDSLQLYYEAMQMK